MTHDDDRLPSDLAARLSELPRDAVPPAGLEHRTAAALRERGLLGRPARRGLRVAMALAAAGLVFLAGYAVGVRRVAAGPAAPGGAGDGATVVVWF